MLHRLPLPPLQIRAEIREIRALLSEGDRLRDTGRFADSLTSARAARARAQVLAWPPLLANARLLEGRSSNMAGRYAEAELWARHADALTPELADPSGLDAAEGHYLLSVVYRGLGDYARAAREGEAAVAIRTEALGAEHPITAAAMDRLGRNDEALVQVEEGLETLAEVLENLRQSFNARYHALKHAIQPPIRKKPNDAYRCRQGRVPLSRHG